MVEVIAIIGPRQSGRTTLATLLAKRHQAEGRRVMLVVPPNAVRWVEKYLAEGTGVTFHPTYTGVLHPIKVVPDGKDVTERGWLSPEVMIYDGNMPNRESVRLIATTEIKR